MAIKANIPSKLNDYSNFSLLIGEEYTVSTGAGNVNIFDSSTGQFRQHPYIPNVNGKFKFSLPSPDGKYVCILSDSPEPVVLIDMETGSKKVTQSYAGGIPQYCAWSPDSSKIAITTNAYPYLQFYDVGTMVEEGGFSAYPDATCPTVHYHPNGNKLFLSCEGATKLIVYAMPAKSVISTPNSTTQVSWGGLMNSKLSKDGSTLIMYGDSASVNGELQVLDTSTYAPTNPTLKNNLHQYYSTGINYSPDGTKVYCWSRNDFRVLDASSGAIISSIAGFSDNSTSAYIRFRKSFWGDNRYIYLLNDAVHMNEIDTIAQTREKFMSYFNRGHRIGQLKNEAQYEIVCTIVESLAEADWEALAIALDSNAVIGKTTFNGSSFTIPVARRTPCTVVVRPAGFGLWTRDTSYSVGDNVYPSNPSAVPYYYECSIGGVSGITEPTWNTTANSVTADGTISWTLIEGIIKPDANSPVIPTPV